MTCDCCLCLGYVLARIEGKLDSILKGEKVIMAQLDDALAALKKIDDATTQEAGSLQQVSDNLDTLIAKIGTTVPPDVLAGLQAQADRVQASADFAKALASKGAPNPVPVPVPPPAPPV